MMVISKEKQKELLHRHQAFWRREDGYRLGVLTGMTRVKELAV